MWKKLIANKILEKFQDLTIGMKNVIYSYYLSLLPGACSTGALDAFRRSKEVMFNKNVMSPLDHFGEKNVSHYLSISQTSITGVRHSTFESLRLGRSNQSIVAGLLRFWDSLNFKKDNEFMVVRCSSMYKITDHPFLIRFIPPTIIDEVITGAPEINLQS
ncbi:hypothetical protein Bca101_059077 [Brassica carinata]